MVERNPHCIHLSASAIAAFKACPTRYLLGYREGLRPAEDTESQRMGTNWGALHEVYYNAYADSHNEATSFDAAVEHLNERYEQVPSTITPEDWETERQILLISFIGYRWYWQDDPIEVLASELPFELPLHAPRTGLPLPLSDVKRVGKIDHLIRWNGMVGPLERKSTARSIDPSGDYWEKSEKDTQVSIYDLSLQDMAQHGLENFGIYGVQDDDRFGNTLYDVWHKPTIKPTKLSQKDTAELLETGKYRGVEFEIETEQDEDGRYTRFVVDGYEAELYAGKDTKTGKPGKPFIRETPTMFGARLLADIYERPEHYFQRREIARNDKQRQKFRVDLFNIYQAIRQFEKTDCWYENEQQCRATFPCQFIPICYGPGADEVTDGETTPAGFRRIFEKEAE